MPKIPVSAKIATFNNRKKNLSLTVSKKNKLIGANPHNNTEITVIADNKYAQCCRIVLLEPKKALKIYRVGIQTISVMRYRAGSLIAEARI